MAGAAGRPRFGGQAALFRHRRQVAARRREEFDDASSAARRSREIETVGENVRPRPRQTVHGSYNPGSLRT